MGVDKDLSYWKANAEEDYMKVPISVLRYITVLEQEVKKGSIPFDKLSDSFKKSIDGIESELNK